MMKDNNYKVIGVNALKEAYSIQRRLLKEGFINEIIKSNEQGDKASKSDIESEKAVINYLKKQKFPCRIISEEHGLIDVVKEPKLLVVLDGIDGSSGLVANPESRCGTMLAIADNVNPAYNQFIFAGVTEFITERIIYGIKDQGVFLIERPGKHEKVRKIIPRKKIVLNSDTLIYVDDMQFWETYAHGVTAGIDNVSKIMKNAFSDKLKGHFKLSGLPSSAAMCIDLILGKVNLIGGVIAKGVFEPPTEYLLVKEIGGTVTEINGEAIDDKKWLEFGRPIKPLLFASHPEVGKKLISFLKKQ